MKVAQEEMPTTRDLLPLSPMHLRELLLNPRSKLGYIAPGIFSWKSTKTKSKGKQNSFHFPRAYCSREREISQAHCASMSPEMTQNSSTGWAEIPGCVTSLSVLPSPCLLWRPGGLKGM